MRGHGSCGISLSGERGTSVNTRFAQQSQERPNITPEKVKALSDLLCRELQSRNMQFRQTYARLLIDEVRVWDDEIRITGPKR